MPRWPTKIRIDTANTATAPTPLAIRSHRGTTSAAETPTGASASIGETLYTCRAAIAEATTLVSTVAATASRYRVARQPVLDASFEPLGHGRRQSTNRNAARENSDARPDGSADQSENRRLREHVANDDDASAADRAQHRDDRPALA